MDDSSFATLTWLRSQCQLILSLQDKYGNPLDLSSVKKSSASASSTPAAATAAAAPTKSAEDAGLKLRQAALERIQGPQKQKEEETKKEEEVVEEAKKEVAKEEPKSVEKAVDATKVKKPTSSLSAMLSRQDEKAAEPVPVSESAPIEVEPAVVTPPAAPRTVTPSHSEQDGKHRFVYSKEELLR